MRRWFAKSILDLDGLKIQAHNVASFNAASGAHIWSSPSLFFSSKADFWTQEIIKFLSSCSVALFSSLESKWWWPLVFFFFFLGPDDGLLIGQLFSKKKVGDGLLSPRRHDGCINGRRLLIINRGQPSWLRCALVHRRRECGLYESSSCEFVCCTTPEWFSQINSCE